MTEPKRRRIGVFGGTFNPVHRAHIRMAEAFAGALELERVILVPTRLPPHKIARDLAGAGDRLAMCRLAVAALPRFAVCDFEVRNEGPSYTYRTLGYLREWYPGEELYLLMGADMFLTVQDWREPDEIFRLAVLCGAQREPGEAARMAAHRVWLEARGARCELLELPPLELSSTQVRDRIRAGEDVSALVDPAVYAYIRDRELYRGE